MDYKKIPWWEPRIGSKQERDNIEKVFADNYANEGKLTTQFEDVVAKALGVKHAIATTSGTNAIFLALKAFGIGHGDEVIVPDATFIATANAVTLAGANPVLVDIDPATLNISTDAFKKAITGKTKAVVPVHVTGRGADMENILGIAMGHGLVVVEDAAEAFFSKYKGKYLGTWSDAGCFSFSAAKTITTGQGGMIVTDNTNFYEKLKPLKDQGRPIRGTGGDDAHNTIGFNFKYTDLQAAIGLGQLDLVGERTARMKRTYSMYKEALSDIPGFKIFDIDIAQGGVPQWVDALVDRRDELDKFLKEFNIDCRRYWNPIHQQKAYPLPDDNFPNSTKYLPKALWLPSAFFLTDEDINTVIGHIRDFYL
ncbi:MAG: DegT/DnrJ/EryC1/StrS family aminotransferase [bacterium]|nr:DegT/DnrJ/EryC1/StrS family aminotransferase [bacterium]